MVYFPDRYPKGREPDREYTFNILNTLRPDFVRDMITHAHTVRNAAVNEENQGEYIEITPAWQAQLDAVPFLSSKSCELVLTLVETKGRTVHLLKQKTKPM